MIKPMRTQVLLEKAEPPTFSSILYTPTPETVEQRGRVLAIGPEVKEVAIGDTVVYLKFKESAIFDNRVLIKEEFVIAVLE